MMIDVLLMVLKRDQMLVKSPTLTSTGPAPEKFQVRGSGYFALSSQHTQKNFFTVFTHLSACKTKDALRKIPKVSHWKTIICNLSDKTGKQLATRSNESGANRQKRIPHHRIDLNKTILRTIIDSIQIELILFCPNKWILMPK